MVQKNSLLIMLLLFVSCSCDDKDKLKKVEPAICYSQEEVCNGRDDDCNGAIDEDTSAACSTACGSGRRACIEGKLSTCPVREPALVDICNDEDDDCNGKIDDIEIKPCYPGNYDNLKTENECRFGIERCENKKNVCRGWIGPKAEQCNGKDDDCDGAIDEDIPTKGLDIVLILDSSCSMGDRTEELANATAQWVTKYSSRPDLRFALVAAPSSNKDFDGMVTLEQNFSNAQGFITILQKQSFNEIVAFEATIDAVHYISTDAVIFDNLTPSTPHKLDWLPGSNKMIIIYSDEPPQSFRIPKLGEQQAIDEAKNNNIPVYVFTDVYTLSDWSIWSNSLVFPQDADLGQALDKIIAENSCK